MINFSRKKPGSVLHKATNNRKRKEWCKKIKTCSRSRKSKRSNSTKWKSKNMNNKSSMRKSKYLAKSKYSWAATNSWKRDKSFSSITRLIKCFTDSIFNGPLCLLISFTSHLPSKHFQGIKLCLSILMRFILFRAVAITPKITLCTWTSGQNCTELNLTITLKTLMMTKIWMKTQNSSTSNASQITISTESDHWMARQLWPFGMMRAKREDKFTWWI